MAKKDLQSAESHGLATKEQRIKIRTARKNVHLNLLSILVSVKSHGT